MPEPLPVPVYVPAPRPESSASVESTSTASGTAEAETETGGDGGPPTPPTPGAKTAYKRKRKEIRRVIIAIGAFLIIYELFGFDWVFLKVLEFEPPEGKDAGLLLPLLLLCVMLAHLTGLMAEGIRLARSLGGDLAVVFLPKGDVDAALTTTTEGKEGGLPKKMWGRDVYRVVGIGDRVLTMLIFCAVVLMGFWVAFRGLVKTEMKPALVCWTATAFLCLAGMRLSQFVVLQARSWRENKNVMEGIKGGLVATGLILLLGVVLAIVFGLLRGFESLLGLPKGSLL